MLVRAGAIIPVAPRMADKATPLPVSLLAEIGRPRDTRIGHDAQALGADEDQIGLDDVEPAQHHVYGGEVDPAQLADSDVLSQPREKIADDGLVPGAGRGGRIADARLPRRAPPHLRPRPGLHPRGVAPHRLADEDRADLPRQRHHCLADHRPQALAVPVLAHRMLVRPEAGPAAGIIRTLLEEVAVPPSLDAGRARP